MTADDTEGPTIDELLQSCLERFEDEGAAAVEEICSTYPELADTLRRRLQRLEGMGLLGGGDDSGLERVLGAPSGLPERLGGFRLKRLLGGGGMGVVYLAEQERLGREVALKVVRPEQLYFPGTRERFKREVETIARLRHPGIVPVHTVGEDEELPYFAMEWVRGATLAQVLDEFEGRDPSTLSGQDFGDAVRRLADDEDEHESASWVGHVFTGSWEESCLRIVRQVADALDYVHRQGIHHRDIKPSNVMITTAGRSMLLDFGLASAEGMSRLTQTGSQLGSVPYMSPEQCRGETQNVDARADIYALGVTLYELLTLRLPFEADTRDEMVRRIVSGRPDEPSSRNRSITWETETVCLSAMELDPRRRYATASDLSHDLGNALERRPIEARRAGAFRRLSLWFQRHPTLGVAMVLGGLLLVGGPLGYALMERDARSRVEEKRVIAEANFEDAVEAVESLLARVAESKLRHVPQVEEIRRALLEDAVRFYERFAERKSDDPDVRFGKARMKLKSADIRRELGENGPAEESFLVAVSELEAVADDYSDRAEVTRQLAYAWRNIGVIQLTTARRDDAVASTERAAEMQRALVGSADVTPADRHELAISLMNLSIMHRQREPERAEAYLDESIEGFEALVRELDDEKYRRQLAQAWNVRGVLYSDRDAQNEARTAYERGIAEFEALVAASPENSDHRRDLAQLLDNLGSALRFDDAEGSLDYSVRSIEIHRRLTEEFPSRPAHRLDLARTLNTYSLRLSDLKRNDSAAAVAEEAMTLLRALVSEAPDVPNYRHELAILLMNHARTHTNSGGYAKAEELASEAVLVSSSLIDGLPAPLVDHLVGGSWQNVGMARKHLGRLEEACEAYENACAAQRRALDVKPDGASERHSMRNHLWMLAETRAALGHHAAGADAARALAALFESDGKESHRAATLLAACVTAASEDGDDSAAMAYANDAVAFLARARTHEFEFDLADPIYDALRDHPDFDAVR